MIPRGYFFVKKLIMNTDSPITIDKFLNKSTLHNGVYKRSNGMATQFNVSSNNDNSILKLEFDHSIFNFNPDLDVNKFATEAKKRDLILTDDDKNKIQVIKQEVYLLKSKFIYNQICDSARVIPKISLLEEKVGSIFNLRIMKNLINLKTFSPLFYTEHCKIRENFIIYQVLIYLCILIIYVYENRENQSFIKIDSDITKVIEWAQCRNLPDLSYIIIGPTVNTNYQIDYKNLYKYLISPANSSLKYGDNITEYMQLMSSRTLEKLVADNTYVNQTRPNPYDKLQNISETYLIYFDTNAGCEFKHNENNDLVVDCQNISIGNVSDDKINMKYDEKINTNKLLNIDPKTASGQLNRLLTKYNTIKINNLLVSESTYQTQLNLYEKLYVVFPNIYMYTRTNQIYNTGTLQISGRFKLNEQYYYEFIPDRLEGISYKTLTAHVKNINFYITDHPGNYNSLIHYEPNLKVESDRIYNVPVVINSRIIPKNKSNYLIEFYINDASNNLMPINKSTFIYNKDHSIIQLLDLEHEDNFIDIDYIVKTFDFNYTEDMNYDSNKYKAYHTNVDILKLPWQLEDFYLSLGMITNQLESLSLLLQIDYDRFIDLGLTPVYNTATLNGLSEIRYNNYFDVNIYYKTKRILYTPQLMCVDIKSNDINGNLVSLNDKKTEYMLQKINNNLVLINYHGFINDELIVLKPKYNIKMILELL